MQRELIIKDDENTIEKLVDEGMIKEPADFFRLSRFKDRIVSMEGMGEKSYANMIASTDKARETEASRLLYSLGVPNIGVATAKLIARAFGNDINKIRNAKAQDLMAIDGIGEIIALSYEKFFEEETVNRNLDELLKEVTIKKEETTGDLKFSGLTFVITGSVTEFKNRKELSSYIEERGGHVAGSVSKNTDYLINNDSMSNSSKNKTAKELGVKIITEAEFLSL